jgi:hypothetical protein
MSDMRVADLTVDELLNLIRTAVRDVLYEERLERAVEIAERNPQFSILDIPPLDIDPRHPGLTVLSREEMYGNDGR